MLEKRKSEGLTPWLVALVLVSEIVVEEVEYCRGSHWRRPWYHERKSNSREKSKRFQYNNGKCIKTIIRLQRDFRLYIYTTKVS